MKPLVTVILPTRERADTLRYALKTVTAQTYSNLEIIVSDNASSPETRKVVEAENDSRIRYINTGERVSMTRNYEFALSHATGEWISMIGDDDGILPCGIERGIALLAHTGQRVLSTVPVTYEWPRFGGADHAGYMKMYPGRGYRIVDTRQHIRALLGGRVDFTRSPMFYTGGIVHRGVYDELASRSHNVLNSLIPDVYSLFAICSVVDSFVQSIDPLMIVGRSSHSSGADLKGAAGTLFFSEITLPWHADLADPPATDTTRAVWLYECFLQSEFLRAANPIVIDPLDQLRLISREFMHRGSPARREAFEAWRERFCAHHRMTMSSRDVTPAAAIGNVVHDLETRFRHVFSYKLTGEPDAPLDTVLDAARTAQRLVDERPSLLANVARLIRHRAGRGEHRT